MSNNLNFGNITGLIELEKKDLQIIEGGHPFWVAAEVCALVIGVYTAAYAYADAKISKWPPAKAPVKCPAKK